VTIAWLGAASGGKGGFHPLFVRGKGSVGWGDVDADEAAFMADSQVPWGVDALGGTISEPAWRNKPSWYLLTTEDPTIPPAAEQMMSQRAGSTVEQIAASHSVYVSQPAAVAAIIEKAASAT
jgi:pimeloyl-ACP methyl ester carboxylesterase